MNLVEVLATAAIWGGASLAVALGCASLRRVALSTRREILLAALAVAAAAPLVAFVSTAFGLGLRPNLESAQPSALVAPNAVPNADSVLSIFNRADQFADVVADPRPAAVAIPATVVATNGAVAAPLPWARLAALAWLVGSTLGFLRIAASVVRLRALRQSLTPCLDARAPGVFTSVALRVPATVGIFDPVVVLPPGLSDDLDDAELAAILRHERAHVTRRDPLGGLVARLARAIHWANPLAHVAARRFDAICESLADGAAVCNRSDLAPRYASCLVRLAERAVAPVAATGVHGIVGGRGALTRRVEALLDPARRPDPRPSRRGRVAAVLLGVVAIVGVGCCCRGSRTLPPACCDEPAPVIQSAATKPDAVDLVQLTAYAGLSNRERQPALEGVHYYEELSFGPGGAPGRPASRGVPDAIAIVPAGAATRAKAWRSAIRSTNDPATRSAALTAVREALGSSDPSMLLAGLRAVCYLDDVDYDRDDFRARILPHAKRPQDDEIRRWARTALVSVKPDPADMPLVIEDAQTAGRIDAELIARDLTTLSQGVIEGATADAVLALLRDGTHFRKAVVMRGLQSAKSFSPAVEARLIAIVRSVDPQDFDSHYFFEFLAIRWDPKSDAVVDAILDTVDRGRDQIEIMLRGLETGLSDSQRERAATRLLVMVDKAGVSFARRLLLTTLAKIAGHAHVSQLEAIAASPNVDATTQALATAAAKAARARR